MAAYHGKNATAFFHPTGGHASGADNNESNSYVKIDNVRSWTCTLNCATADTTGMAANGRLQAVGLKSGTASVECVYDGAVLVQLDESTNGTYVANTSGIQLQLLRTIYDADKGYMGGVILTSVDVSTSIDGTPIVTYNFNWVGTVSATTTVGTTA